MLLGKVISLVFIALSIPSFTEEFDKAINHTCFSLGWWVKNVSYFAHNKGDKQGFRSRGQIFPCLDGKSRVTVFERLRIMEAKTELPKKQMV